MGVVGSGNTSSSYFLQNPTTNRDLAPRRREVISSSFQGQVKPQPKGKRPQAAKPARPKQLLTINQVHERMLASGLITRLPDPAQDIDDDDPEDAPIAIEGEPLSETIIRERR
jgi:hypothetical protein